MGLPHILVRFHTSPDGRGARRTAAITVALLGAFYLFPGVYGLLGAVLLPQLYLSGATDTVVVALPARVDPGRRASLFTALLTAGAFAAFLATSLGMLLAVSGARLARPGPRGPAPAAVDPAGRRGRGRAARAARRASIDVGVLVTSAFAVAASTFCPLLVLGHLVAAADRARGDGGHVVGLLASAGVIGRGPAARAPSRGCRDPARPARAVVGAAGVRDDGRGVAARAAAVGGRGGDAAAAPRRDGGGAVAIPAAEDPAGSGARAPTAARATGPARRPGRTATLHDDVRRDPVGPGQQDPAEPAAQARHLGAHRHRVPVVAVHRGAQGEGVEPGRSRPHQRASNSACRRVNG